ncbi:aminoglycoside phosphotransferase [Variovorax paradoxus]|uniref:Aminoglycoside phosphotransferase n=1 Tax=Variovorax paradoxus TaxID=34073 RepID=A0A5Q0MCF7_VARPD|nr:aminoglycoside phosphotransferase [Variovorax paradoxus]QFZ86165.1 aminoglycoside phosphotransferase [Variovorax paradoxus]
MADLDTDIPVPASGQADSLRARLQALAERVGVLAPGAPLTDELVAFAEGAIEMARGAGPRNA